MAPKEPANLQHQNKDLNLSGSFNLNHSQDNLKHDAMDEGAQVKESAYSIV